MKFKAHGTFFIRRGWLGKGMRHVARNPEVFISRDEKPMDVLGLGANMVTALRYWLQAVGLTREPSSGKRTQTFTEMGELIFKHDPYLEETGTLWLLQYRLAANINDATAWYFFFNEFSMQEFTRDDFVEALQKFILREGGASTEISLRSLAEDFQCIVNSYLPRGKLAPEKFSPENNLVCPLAELGLLDVLNSRQKIFRKRVPSTAALNPWIVFAVIVDNAARKELPLTELLRAPRNVGRVFNLDSIALLDVLHSVERLGLVKINRTAGLDVITIEQELTFLDCVKNFYAAATAREVSR